MILNNGAYTSYGPGVSVTQSMLGGAVYKIPHYRYDGYTVYTNTGCTQGAQDAGTKTVTNGGVPDSDPITFNVPHSQG